MAARRDLRGFVQFGKKIVAVARNFKDHAAELNNPVPQEPVVFLKPTSSYIVQGQKIQIPQMCTELHHEVELGVVIGEPGKRIDQLDAMKHIGGYTLALDMTARDLQNKLKDKRYPWTIAKGFDTACPVSEFIPKDSVPDPHNVDLWLKVDGEVKQCGNTKDMIFSVPKLISFISQIMTLEEGDLILTGTPAGVLPVKPGQQITAGLGNLIEISFPVS